jgi:hypothetical protein
VSRDALITGLIIGLPGLVLFVALELDARRHGRRELERRRRGRKGYLL